MDYEFKQARDNLAYAAACARDAAEELRGCLLLLWHAEEASQEMFLQQGDPTGFVEGWSDGPRKWAREALGGYINAHKWVLRRYQEATKAYANAQVQGRIDLETAVAAMAAACATLEAAKQLSIEVRKNLDGRSMPSAEVLGNTIIDVIIDE